MTVFILRIRSLLISGYPLQMFDKFSGGDSEEIHLTGKVDKRCGEEFLATKAVDCTQGMGIEIESHSTPGCNEPLRPEDIRRP